MAPVASGIADGEKDRLILRDRFTESGLAPGVPCHRIRGVQKEVRTGLSVEVVGHGTEGAVRSEAMRSPWRRKTGW